MNTLSMLIHGGSKVGKTWFADTAPAPRLVLDAEGGNRFTPSRKIEWDPLQYAPPTYDGSWDTCVVYVRNYQTVQSVYNWLNMGEHPFRSVTMDSVSEVQQRCIDALVGTSAMQQQDWGELLRNMSSLVLQFRDLTIHPTRPIEVVTLIAMTRETVGKWKPYVQGQLAVTLPYYIDVIGYLHVATLESGQAVRRLLVQPQMQFEAGDRTGRLAPMIDNPHIQQMLVDIYGGTPTQ